MRYLLILTFVVLSGCAGSAVKTNDLSLGMTKSEVIAIFGQPESSRASNGVEFFTYKLTPGTKVGTGAGCAAIGLLTLGISYFDDRCTGGTAEEYYVQFKSGKVSGYGKMGDFDSTKSTTFDLNHNININKN
jgi:hypothetical protein